MISTVDVEARHGHKSRARTFDGYKSHFSVDPGEGLITNVAVTAANTADRRVIDELLSEPATDTRAGGTETGGGAPPADPESGAAESAASTGADGGSDSAAGCEQKDG